MTPPSPTRCLDYVPPLLVRAYSRPTSSRQIWDVPQVHLLACQWQVQVESVPGRLIVEKAAVYLPGKTSASGSGCQVKRAPENVVPVRYNLNLVLPG